MLFLMIMLMLMLIMLMLVMLMLLHTHLLAQILTMLILMTRPVLQTKYPTPFSI
jgi:hypothetical protein